MNVVPKTEVEVIVGINFDHFDLSGPSFDQFVKHPILDLASTAPRSPKLNKDRVPGLQHLRLEIHARYLNQRL